MVWLTDAHAPESMRLYAIGDVHGCAEALDEIHHAIQTDLDARPVADWRVIHLGDYVDRGPASREVIDRLIARTRDDARMVCLCGNHDEMLLQGLGDDPQMRELWLANGGVETLESYGLTLADYIDAVRGGVTEEIIPAAHREFLEGLAASVHFGDYYFVHAGIDPRRSLDRQERAAQLWIRAPFLDCAEEFEAVIVHGHTPVRQVDARANRIGIDTGAVFGGRLTCLVLERAEKGLLTAEGVTPLPPPPEPEPEEALAGARRRGVIGRIAGGLWRRR